MRGYLLVVTAAVLFGINAGMSRVPIHAGLDTGTYTSVRVTGAFLVYVALAAVIRPSVLRPPRGRGALLILVLGVAGVAAMQWSYNIAVVRLPIGIALLIEYLAPVYVVLWVRFVRREPVHPRIWPAIALALVGLAVVGQVWQGLTLDGIGVLAALAAGLTFAGYFLLGERLTTTDEGTDALHVIVWAFAAAAVVMNVLHPVWTATDLGNDASLLGRLADITWPAWAAMTWVVILGTVAPFFLYLFALQYLPSQRASVVAMTEPVVAVMVGWWWFGESLTTAQLTGVTAVVAGILLAQSARDSSS